MIAGIEMPKYKSHKEVWALKIKGINGTILSWFGDNDYEPVDVGEEYMSKHKPQVGGYYVVYKDGYKSFSPAEAFEEGYTSI